MSEQFPGGEARPPGGSADPSADPSWPPPAGQYPPPPASPYGSQYGSPYGGYYGPAGYAPPRNSGTAIAALVCAIGSFVFCPFVLAIVALVLCASAGKEIRQSGGAVTGDGMVRTARILAWVSIGVWAVLMVGYILLIVFAVTHNSSTTALAAIA